MGGGATGALPLLSNLTLVVGLPMAAGIAVRTVVSLSARHEPAAERVSVGYGHAHPGAQEIADRVKADQPEVAEATVHRTLNAARAR